MQAPFLAFLNRPVTPPVIKHQYNKAIEQYRGVCALMVMISHGFVHADMLQNNFKWPEYMNYIGAGYLSVIIFFCISGYVIGINYSSNLLDVKTYVKKRLIRLYPIYLIAITLCLPVAGGFTAYTLLGNIFFLQNNVPYIALQVPPLVNYVTWSLNYEVLYYTFFIALFLIRPKIWRLILFMLICSIVTMPSSANYLFLGNYINGFYFWLLGLFFAWKLVKSDENKNVPFIPFLSLIFLHMCQHYLGLGEIILHILGIHVISNINWLFDLPFCLMIMSVLTSKTSTFLNFNKIVCYAVPGCVFLFLIFHHRLFEDIRWIMCVIYWLLALLTYFEKKVSGFLMDKFTSAGKISYGLYLLHVPVGYLIKSTVFIWNEPAEIAVKYFLWFSITIGLSILTELKLQPFIKRYFSA